MARYIDVDELIAEYDRVHIGVAGGARKLMVDAPTADVQEVKHGEWLSRCGTGQYDDYYCSLCGMCEEGTRNKDCLGNYCSWCGAKMDLGRY